MLPCGNPQLLKLANQNKSRGINPCKHIYIRSSKKSTETSWTMESPPQQRTSPEPPFGSHGSTTPSRASSASLTTALPENATQQPCRKTSLRQKPWWRKEEGGRNPNSGERRSCHVLVCYCTVKLVKPGQTVNSSQIFKSGQRLVKQEGFNCKYWYFWMSLQIWTTGLKMAYWEN